MVKSNSSILRLFDFTKSWKWVNFFSNSDGINLRANNLISNSPWSTWASCNVLCIPGFVSSYNPSKTYCVSPRGSSLLSIPNTIGNFDVKIYKETGIYKNYYLQ